MHRKKYRIYGSDGKGKPFAYADNLNMLRKAITGLLTHRQKNGSATHPFLCIQNCETGAWFLRRAMV